MSKPAKKLDSTAVIAELRRALRRAQIQLLVPPSQWAVDVWQHTLNDIHNALSRKVSR